MSRMPMRRWSVVVTLLVLLHGLVAQTTAGYKPQACWVQGVQSMPPQDTTSGVQAPLPQGVAAQDTLNEVKALLQTIETKVDDQATAAQCSGRLTNVASSAQGGTCLASSEWSSGYICHFAIDDNIHTEWASKGQGLGAWLKISFARPSVVRLVRIMQRYDRLDQFKEVLLELSDGSAQKFTLTQRTGSNLHDIRGRWWDSFATNPTLSQFLKIEAVSVYTSDNNGFREVEVWANEQ